MGYVPVVDIMSLPPVSRVVGACTHDQHRQATCDRCVAACPTGAFALANGDLTLSADHCVRCGYCVQACPTGAIRGQSGGEKLTQRAADIPNLTRMEIACAYHSVPLSLADPQAALFIAPRCLAGLSAATYLELANQGVQQVTLRCDRCATCSIGELITQIHETAAIAQTLTATAPTLKIDIVTAAPENDVPPSVVYDTTRTGMSRRGLFRMFADSLESEPTTTTADTDVIPLPPERQRLLTALAARPEPTTLTSKLSVTGVCTACEVCTKMCPTDALLIEKGRDQFQLSLNIAHCTTCDLCTVACPEAVLQWGTETTSAEVGATVPLAQGDLHHCKRCKTTFSGEGDLCPPCAFRRQNLFGSTIINAKRLGS